MQYSQFKRRLKRARRASQRIANGRSQPQSVGAARWVAEQRARQSERFGTEQRPVQTTSPNNLIGR